MQASFFGAFIEIFQVYSYIATVLLHWCAYGVYKLSHLKDFQMMKKILLGTFVAVMAVGFVACDESDKLDKTIDTATNIADKLANCKKTQICIQADAFRASIEGKDTCEAKAAGGTEYISKNHDAMKDAITEYSGVTDWKSVDSGTCSLTTIKHINDCAKDMKNTYENIKACESAMTEEQKNAFNSWDDFNNELDKVAEDSGKAAEENKEQG